MEWLRRIRATWSWARFAWQVAIFFGVSGFLASIGGSIWAMILGVPTPIALMVGYCTLVGAVYLAMAPLAYRLITAEPRTTNTLDQRPDYKAWKIVSVLDIREAAYLWREIEPENPGMMVPTKVSGWIRALVDQVMTAKLDFIPDLTNNPGAPNINPDVIKHHQRVHANWNTKLTRAELQKFAKANGYNPAFLRD
jgi:hypothetical protein